MSFNFSFNPDFEFENSDLDESLLQEGVTVDMHAHVSVASPNHSILKQKGEVKSQERNQFMDQLMTQWIEQISRVKSATPSISVKSAKEKSVSKTTLKEDIKLMLSELVSMKKTKSDPFQTQTYEKSGTHI
eukprot:CAMPEP_0168335220 /NCGR_PEP_ID=MMETSP0213-20121227/10773_1 /TAXON_ID=151035 /ORGANISM="Euplotes harpa, Strain FSP1.4" /LENGTH=130 /DNA_ID=CAMNT_0008340093 /DNA_START=140 /DNA_END=532 /DNA_ORIENTATION=+